jgi:glycosyltransferase involved in cell wall biosynthesis
VHGKDEVKEGVRIIALPRVPRWRRPLLWLRLLRHALASRADIYLFHDPELLLVTPWLHLLTGKPTVYDVHEAYPDFIRVKDYLPVCVRHPIAWLFNRLEPLLARLQSGLIFADDQIAASFARVHCAKVTLYNYPERGFVEEASAATYETGEWQPVVLYLGAMERNRGSRLMVKAFAQVLAALPRAQLLHVGHMAPPDLEDEVRGDLAARDISPAVTLAGRVPFEQIGEFLKRAAVGWVTWQPVPKNEKNVPTKLFEYMAYGLPVVCSDLSSTRPFVRSGENGYLVTADDPAAHARAILRLLRDPEAASAMGQRGQQLVHSHWNWDEMAERLLLLFQELLS